MQATVRMPTIANNLAYILAARRRPICRGRENESKAQIITIYSGEPTYRIPRGLIPRSSPIRKQQKWNERSAGLSKRPWATSSSSYDGRRRIQRDPPKPRPHLRAPGRRQHGGRAPQANKKSTTAPKSQEVQAKAADRWRQWVSEFFLSVLARIPMATELSPPNREQGARLCAPPESSDRAALNCGGGRRLVVFAHIPSACPAPVGVAALSVLSFRSLGQLGDRLVALARGRAGRAATPSITLAGIAVSWVIFAMAEIVLSSTLGVVAALFLLAVLLYAAGGWPLFTAASGLASLVDGRAPSLRPR